MNRRKKMIAYRRSPRYLNGMLLAGIVGALTKFVKEKEVS